MIERDLARKAVELAGWYPVVTVTGPRQSGKTTLARHVFSEKPYVTLEPMDTRARVSEDPRGFLADHPDGAVVDEVQNVPELLGYLQEDVDEHPDPGRWLLTGSQHLGLTEAVAQSLAGRTGILYLYPPSYAELQRFPDPPTELWTTIWSGAYPRIWDTRMPPDEWLRDYATTYVERDVRRVLDVGDLESFRGFLELCAGRTSAELNLAALGSDAGVARNTARAWLSVLEATFVCFRVRSWSPNVRKRLVRAAKLHFIDTGLVCHLLGITTPDQLRRHPLRGALFETWVASEILKAGSNQGRQPRLAHFRESRGLEVDLVVEDGDRVTLVESKSGSTVAGEFLHPLHRLADLIGEDFNDPQRVLVYGGRERQQRRDIDVLPWFAIHDRQW